MMNCYAPGHDVGPIGYQPVEFLDIPRMSESFPPALDQPDRSTLRLNDQTLSNVTRWAHEYIAALVRGYDGASEDVHAVIQVLHAQSGHLEADVFPGQHYPATP
jgi:hypothetical protein